MDEERRRRLGAAIAALILLLVSAWVVLLSPAVSALGVLLVSTVVLSIVGLFVLPRAGAQPGGGLSRTRRVAIGSLGLVAVIAYLASGLLLLLSLAVSPNPGHDLPVLALKAADVIGWLAVGLWLLLDWSQFRLRVVVPPVAAWLWVFLLAAALGGLGYLAWGP